MFHKKAIGCDVVAVDDQPVRAGIAGPTDTCPVISAPDPSVVHDSVITVDLKIAYRAAYASAADAEKDIVERDRILYMTGSGFMWTDLEQDRRLGRTCVEEKAGDNDAVCICSGHRCGAVDRTQRGESQTQHDRVGMG